MQFAAACALARKKWDPSVPEQNHEIFLETIASGTTSLIR
jgi:hypothetical protein